MEQPELVNAILLEEILRLIINLSGSCKTDVVVYFLDDNLA